MWQSCSQSALQTAKRLKHGPKETKQTFLARTEKRFHKAQPNTMHRLLFVLALAFLIALPARSQSTTYDFNPDSSKIWVDGTSNNTPHWTVYATEFSGSITLNTEADNAHAAVESATLTVPTRMLKSRKSGIMDRVMYDAIETQAHPEVTFNLTEVSDLEATSETSATFVVHGELTLAGETRTVSIPVEANHRDDGTVVFSGNHVITMQDYGLKPATAMFGAMRTGPDVTVSAELHIGPLQQ